MTDRWVNLHIELVVPVEGLDPDADYLQKMDAMNHVVHDLLEVLDTSEFNKRHEGSMSARLEVVEDGRGIMQACQTGTDGWRGHCSRGGIGCPLEHEDDPDDMRRFDRTAHDTAHEPA